MSFNSFFDPTRALEEAAKQAAEDAARQAAKEAAKQAALEAAKQAARQAAEDAAQARAAAAQDMNVPRYQGSRTSSILARSAFMMLEQAPKENLDLALNTLANKNIPAERLIEELERSPFSFQQVLSELARGWRQEDINGFAEKFGMPKEQLDVMDAIVSLAILNDPALEPRLRAENQVPSTPTDFLSSRRVIWQSVEPGSVLNPPYVILIAVEAVDTAMPNEVVQSILGQLGVFRGYKLPQAAVARLSGSPETVARTAIVNPRIALQLANPVAAGTRLEAAGLRRADLFLRPQG
jgi:hypothetical protein